MSVEWFGETLTPLPPEYERIKPPSGQVLRAEVSGWRLGTKTVHVRPGYAARDKVAIGLDINRLDKPDKIHHWAIVGPEPVAQLEPELANRASAGQVFTFERVGKPPTEFWIIGVEPAPAKGA